jgi:dihydroorotase
LHAHFREPGYSDKETLESASLAAVAGGYATLVCMANTRPVMDTPEAAAALKARSDALGLIDLYPALALTVQMEGKEITHYARAKVYNPPLVSEDGKDVADEALFVAAMKEAKQSGALVSCHCDHCASEAESAERAIHLGQEAGCHTHICHISTADTVNVIRFSRDVLHISRDMLTCEATPHHIAATRADAERMGLPGRVNPPLAGEADRLALIEALVDGTVDAIASDHAPHSRADKEAGAPGFPGLETAFGVCYTELVRPETDEGINLQRLSALMSANPARLLGLHDRGRIAPGLRADLTIVDTGAEWMVNSAEFRSRGRYTPFEGRKLRGKVLLTMHKGKVVYHG